MLEKAVQAAKAVFKPRYWAHAAIADHFAGRIGISDGISLLDRQQKAAESIAAHILSEPELRETHRKQLEAGSDYDLARKLGHHVATHLDEYVRRHHRQAQGVLGMPEEVIDIGWQEKDALRSRIEDTEHGLKILRKRLDERLRKLRSLSTEQLRHELDNMNAHHEYASRLHDLVDRHAHEYIRTGKFPEHLIEKIKAAPQWTSLGTELKSALNASMAIQGYWDLNPRWYVGTFTYREPEEAALHEIEYTPSSHGREMSSAYLNHRILQLAQMRNWYSAQVHEIQEELKKRD